jgi:O-antigen ligase
MRSFSPVVAATALLAALPWLNPFAPGPSAAVAPWMASAACGLALAALAGWQGARWNARLLALLALVPLWAALSQWGVRPEVAMLAAGLALVGLASRLPADAGHALVRGVQWGWLAAAALTAAVGLAQYFGLAAALAPWVNVTEAGEAFGNLRQRNQFASLCWIGAAVLLWGTVRVPRAAALAVVVLLAAASAASVSRTGFVQGLALTALAALWPGPRRRERLALCAAAAATYLAASWALPVLLEAATGVVPRSLWGRIATDEGCSSRLVLWSNVLRLVALKPLAGWGWGELDYAHFMTLYPGARFCDILDNAHNLPLHLAVELGVPAALAICGGTLAWMLRLAPWRETEPLRQLAWAVLAVLLLHSLLEYPLWYGPFQLALGAALGWLVQREPEAPPATTAARWRTTAPAAALAVLLLFAAWDYQRVSQIYLAPEQRRAGWGDDTLAHVRKSWLFAGPARFAELTLTYLTRANARWMAEASEATLHYSPEPRVIERSIESLTMLDRFDDAVIQLARYRAAFPREYAAWREAQKRPMLPPPQ